MVKLNLIVISINNAGELNAISHKLFFFTEKFPSRLIEMYTEYLFVAWELG